MSTIVLNSRSSVYSYTVRTSRHPLDARRHRASVWVLLLGISFLPSNETRFPCYLTRRKTTRADPVMMIELRSRVRVGECARGEGYVYSKAKCQ